MLKKFLLHSELDFSHNPLRLSSVVRLICYQLISCLNYLTDTTAKESPLSLYKTIFLITISLLKLLKGAVKIDLWYDSNKN